MTELLPEFVEFIIHAYYHIAKSPAFNLSHAIQMKFINDTDLDLKASNTLDHVSYTFGYNGVDYKFPPKDVSRKNACYIIATTNTWQVDIVGTILYHHEGVRVLTINFKNPLVSINENLCETWVNTDAFPSLGAYVKHVSGIQEAFYEIVLTKKPAVK